jgi:hypothetical protein
MRLWILFCLAATLTVNGQPAAGTRSGSVPTRGAGNNGNTTSQTDISSFVDAEVPAGVIDGKNGTYKLAAVPTPTTSLQVYRNGLLLRRPDDYTLTGSTVNFVPDSLPQPGDLLQAFYRAASSTSSTSRSPAPLTTGDDLDRYDRALDVLHEQALGLAKGEAQTPRVMQQLGSIDALSTRLGPAGLTRSMVVRVPSQATRATPPKDAARSRGIEMLVNRMGGAPIQKQVMPETRSVVWETPDAR